MMLTNTKPSLNIKIKINYETKCMLKHFKGHVKEYILSGVIKKIEGSCHHTAYKINIL